MRMGIHFHTNLYIYLALVKFLALLPGRSVCVDIDNNVLIYITLDHYFSFIKFYIFYIGACDLVFSCCCLYVF